MNKLKLLTALLVILVVNISCEREEDVKDYRDKWEGVYTGLFEAFIHYTMTGETHNSVLDSCDTTYLIKSRVDSAMMMKHTAREDDFFIFYCDAGGAVINSDPNPHGGKMGQIFLDSLYYHQGSGGQGVSSARIFKQKAISHQVPVNWRKSIEDAEKEFHGRI